MCLNVHILYVTCNCMRVYCMCNGLLYGPHDALLDSKFVITTFITVLWPSIVANSVITVTFM